MVVYCHMELSCMLHNKYKKVHTIHNTLLVQLCYKLMIKLMKNNFFHRFYFETCLRLIEVKQPMQFMQNNPVTHTSFTKGFCFY